MEIGDLNIYKLSREISREAWIAYAEFDWSTKKIIGNQWITAIDSVGANIAEGFGRYHFADKNKFNYNARGSLIEAQHWTSMLYERNLITPDMHATCSRYFEQLLTSLNAYIQVTKNQISGS